MICETILWVVVLGLVGAFMIVKVVNEPHMDGPRSAEAKKN